MSWKLTKITNCVFWFDLFFVKCSKWWLMRPDSQSWYYNKLISPNECRGPSPSLRIARNTSPGLIRHQPNMSSITPRLVMFSLRITKTISTNEKMKQRIYVLCIISNESCEALQLIPKNLRLLFSAKFVFSIEQISRSKIFFKLLPAHRNSVFSPTP